jgi:hypothetical protein
MSRQLQAMLRRSSALTSEELETGLVPANRHTSLRELLVVQRLACRAEVLTRIEPHHLALSGVAGALR